MQCTGYEVQIAKDYGFTMGVKKAVISKNTTISKKMTGLAANTYYYVRVRTYKVVNGVKYYSEWTTPSWTYVSK